MSGAEILAMIIVIFIGISLIIAYIYGVVLAIKLMLMGEWQWFCLPFLALPLGVAGRLIAHIPFAFMPYNEWRAALIGSFSILSVIALLSGCCVYWLLRRFRRETSFVHFYAANYFLCAAVLSGFIIAIFIGDGAALFSRLLQIVPVYGFIVTLAGIAVMYKRVKKRKENALGAERHNDIPPIKNFETAEFPQPK